MIRIRVPALAVMAAAFLLVSCTGSDSVATRPSVAAPDPQWVTSISQHSNGAISRHSPVRVLFTSDVVPQERVGSNASANITITPAVKVSATFASRREIVLRATPEFAPGTDYRISVRAQGLSGVPADTKPFEFMVKTLDVNFDVRTYGLDVEQDRNELMVLRGAILTADSEDRELIEKIVTATLDGKPLVLVWTAGEHEHGFTINDIARKREEQEVVLKWDGAPLNLKNAGSQSWRIPGLDEFAVTQTQAVQLNDQRQIQVRFSDALDARQDLKGRVRLSQGEFTTSINGNLLTVYLNEDVVGEVTLTLEPAIRSRSGQSLVGMREFKLEFTNTRPQVRFVGTGVILPDAKTLSVPFEAVSARAVRVTALQVYEANIPQFLQVNALERLTGTRPRRPRVVAQDHSAGLAGSGQVDPLRPRRDRAHRQTPGRLVPADALAGARRRALRLSRRFRNRCSRTRTDAARTTATPATTPTGTTTARSTTKVKSTGMNATIPASRRITATDATSAPHATCSHPTSA